MISKVIISLFILTVTLSRAAHDCPAAYKVPEASFGSLVDVEITGTVGFLLIDVPSGPERDRAASLILGLHDNDWDKRVRVQSHYTDYRFQFRKYFNPGTDALSLPDDTLFQITYNGAARREDFNSTGNPEDTPSLDAIVRDYTLKVVIVTDIDSAAVADPALGIIGGSVVEVVDVPLDPTEFIERAPEPEARACLVEANYPEKSWSTSLPYSLFLDYCTVDNAKPLDATERECLYCHCTLPYPTLDCYRMLELYTGRVTLNAVFTRLAWNSVIANQWRFLPAGEPSEGANLVPYEKDLRQVYVKYRYFEHESAEVHEKCVKSSGWRKLVTFSSVDSNNGKYAFHLGPVNYHVGNDTLNPTFQRGGLFYLDPRHGHYHTPYYSNFTAEGKYHTFASNDTKRGFCLVSSKRVVNDIWAPWASPYTACDFQGITAGSADIYNEGIPCQWIDITDLPEGKIDLGVKINAWDALPEGILQCNDTDGEILTVPSGLIACTDDLSECVEVQKPVVRRVAGEEEPLDDNDDSVRFDNEGDGESIITTKESQYGRNQEIGFRRNNEFSLYGAQLRECTLNSTVTLSCNIPNSNAVNDNSEVVRVCESSRRLNSALACLYQDSLNIGDSVVLPGASATQISFACPGPRHEEDEDGGESGGAYSLYRAHAVKTLGKHQVPDVVCSVVS